MSRGGAGRLVSVAKADILTGNNRHIITLTITSVIACMSQDNNYKNLDRAGRLIFCM